MEPAVEKAVLAAMAANVERPAPAPGGVAAMPGHCYADGDVHARELERVFRRRWIPVARESELAEVGSFATVALAGDQLALVRGEDGRLRAMHNVCKHRGAQILRCQRGQVRELHCPYHGMGYGLDGVLKSALAPDSLAPQLRLGATQLRPVALASLCGWAWLNLDPDPPRLEAELGPALLDELGNWPFAELGVVTSRVLPVEFDWKVGVEAFLEPYHVPAMHARTAHPLVDFRGMAVREFGRHSRMALPFRSIDAYGPDGVIGHAAAEADVEIFAGLNRAQRTAHFVYFLFPSTVLMLQPNHVVFLRFLPRGPGRCSLGYELLAAPARSSAAGDYYQSLVEGYDRLLKEDLENLPWIQQGVADRSFEGSALSGYETRIAAFWRELNQQMKP